MSTTAWTWTQSSARPSRTSRPGTSSEARRRSPSSSSATSTSRSPRTRHRAQAPRGEDGDGLRGSLLEAADPRAVPQHRHLRHQRRRHRGGRRGASQVCFNKHVSDLSVKEAALLAGLPQAPSQYNPFINPERATQRRNLVLDAMQEQGYIDAAEYQEMVSSSLGLERGARYDEIESSTSSTTYSRS